MRNNDWREARYVAAAAALPATPDRPLTTADIAKAPSPKVKKPEGGAQLRCAYQGFPGAYSEMACKRAFPQHDPLPCEQFEIAFQALSQWLCDRAALPIENSLGGSIHMNYDLLMRYNLHIVGETSLKIQHCLCALPGTKKKDLVRVMSHPQALAQCDGYIRALGIQREAVDDTAGAAQMIALQNLVNTAAVCSTRAAELYGLDILDVNIQDVKNNVTRFVLLSRDPLISKAEDKEPFKTSIVFSLGEGPGQLFKALAVFALRDLDLLKIESRPLREQPLSEVRDQNGDPLGQRFNYLFYVDFVGKLADVKVQNALRHLGELTTFVRVLGSFPIEKESTSTDDMISTMSMSADSDG